MGKIIRSRDFDYVKTLSSLILISSVLCLLSISKVTMAGLIGSAHNFSAGGGCVSCHISYDAEGNDSKILLLDHEITTASHVLYSSSTLDAIINEPSYFGSRLCLSCHDGTVALDSYDGATGTNFITGPSNLDTDLSNDHPVSFMYDTDLANADGGLRDPVSADSGLGGTIQEDLLVNNFLECNSCHNIHSSNTKLLVKSNAGSGLCLTCHEK